MDILNPLLAIKIIFILGTINLLTGMMIFFSCRCLLGSKIGSKLMKYRLYQRFFKLHCYIWWIFWVSVMVHAVLAMVFIGAPA
ncbi:hypothetical protein ACFLU1_04320 [Chloroflexota bacterium]